jgi:UDP-N-acetylglucosamine transferase subunit ALG13
VLVVVGTDHHPFDRLVSWMDRWAQRHPGVGCFVQYGTAHAPAVCDGIDYLAHPDLQARMQAAGAVVSHGGPGTIMEMRAHGHSPVVVARDPVLGEHVDGHQQRFARVVAEAGVIRLVTSEDELERALDEALGAERADPGETSTRAATSAAKAFGALVDARLQTPTKRRWLGRFGSGGA